MTRVRRMAAVLTTLAAVVLATTGQNDAQAATPSTAPAAPSKPATTDLHLHVVGCDSCQITLQHAVDGQPKVWSSATRTVGSDHVASWTVPPAKTRGMSFVLHAPWAGNTGAVPNFVTRYRSSAVDDKVSQRQARTSGHAEGCWAGTSIDDVTLDFRVARIDGETVTGQSTKIPLAYATHAMSSWRPMVKTYRGTIGNQDAFYCTAPATTKVTLTARGCEGCQVGLQNGAARIENLWQSETGVIADGRVRFVVPRNETRGLTGVLSAPWEGATGYLTMIAFRYAGHSTGDPITFQSARAATKGAPCWAGTTDARTTIALTIRKVTVPGTTGPAAGIIAYVDVTQPWLKPMLPAGKGVLGTQSVITCAK